MLDLITGRKAVCGCAAYLTYPKFAQRLVANDGLERCQNRSCSEQRMGAVCHYDLRPSCCAAGPSGKPPANIRPVS